MSTKSQLSPEYQYEVVAAESHGKRSGLERSDDGCRSASAKRLADS